MNREQIAEKYKWDLSKIFKNEEEFRNSFKNVEQEIDSFSNYEKKMKESASDFYNTLTKYYEISRKLDKLIIYSHLLFDEDTSNNKNQTLSGEVSNLVDKAKKPSGMGGLFSFCAAISGISPTKLYTILTSCTFWPSTFLTSPIRIRLMSRFSTASSSSSMVA